MLRFNDTFLYKFVSNLPLRKLEVATYKLAWQGFATVPYLTQLRFVTEVRLLRNCGAKISQNEKTMPGFTERVAEFQIYFCLGRNCTMGLTLANSTSNSDNSGYLLLFFSSNKIYFHSFYDRLIH